MTDKRRGRPALPEAERRQQIGVRTAPSLKADLERAAAENGRSVAQEAELRLVQSFEAERQAGGRETARLLSMLANEIALIEMRTRKAWHRDLTTWAAVAEMFSKGPLRRLRPDRYNDDEVVGEAWSALWKVRQQKEPLLNELRNEGLFAEDLPDTSTTSRRGIFGAMMFSDKESLLNRTPLRRAIQARADLSDDHKERVEGLVDKLVSLDADERVAIKAHRDALQPYFDAEHRGRELYAVQLREAVSRARAEGQPFNLLDFL